MFRYTVKKHGISRMGGRAYSKNQDGAQTCRFCRLDVDDTSEPHSFITRVDRDRPQHRGAGGRFGRAVGRQQAAVGMCALCRSSAAFRRSPSAEGEEGTCNTLLAIFCGYEW